MLKKKRSAKLQVKVITDPKKLEWLRLEIEKRKTMERKATHRSIPVSRTDK